MGKKFLIGAPGFGNASGLEELRAIPVFFRRSVRTRIATPERRLFLRSLFE